MDKTLQIRSFTLLLSAVAGFCDTATFVSGDAVFSAHVTGNFIVFAAQAIVGSDAGAWIKLLTFPVFVLAVITGGHLAEKASNICFLLLVESLLLLACGGTALWVHHHAYGNHLQYAVVLAAVFSMGLQNAFGKLYAKETYGPTTMMTGNVTQAALDLGSLLRHGLAAATADSLKKQLFPIGGFLTGCLCGALFSSLFGLVAILLPGLALLLGYTVIRKQAL